MALRIVRRFDKPEHVQTPRQRAELDAELRVARKATAPEVPTARMRRQEQMMTIRANARRGDEAKAEAQ